MMDDETIKLQADDFARKNKKTLAKELTTTAKFPSEKIPVSVFMAGSPGAGKTESSKNLIDQFVTNGNSILRIDPDEIRDRIPGYTGKNSSLFQGATSIIANKMQDLALVQRQSYIFDGTLTNLEAARSNIQRNIDHERDVFIVYVYQDPRQAWNFVKAREKKDGRTIPKDAFISQYFQARCKVNMLNQEYGKGVMIYLVIKNIDGSDFGYHQNIDIVDNYIPERYSREQLEALIIE
jgi:predicted ABC-type ATPase